MSNWITPENSTWIMWGLLLVGLVCTIRLVLAALRDELFEDDRRG